MKNGVWGQTQTPFRLGANWRLDLPDRVLDAALGGSDLGRLHTVARAGLAEVFVHVGQDPNDDHTRNHKQNVVSQAVSPRMSVCSIIAYNTTLSNL